MQLSALSSRCRQFECPTKSPSPSPAPSTTWAGLSSPVAYLSLSLAVSLSLCCLLSRILVHFISTNACRIKINCNVCLCARPMLNKFHVPHGVWAMASYGTTIIECCAVLRYELSEAISCKMCFKAHWSSLINCPLSRLAVSIPVSLSLTCSIATFVIYATNKLASALKLSYDT